MVCVSAARAHKPITMADIIFGRKNKILAKALRMLGQNELADEYEKSINGIRVNFKAPNERSWSNMTKYTVSVYDDTDDEEYPEKCFEQEFRRKEEAVNIFKTKAEEIISNIVSKDLYVGIWREFNWTEGAWMFKCTIGGYKDKNKYKLPVISRTVYLND